MSDNTEPTCPPPLQSYLAPQGTAVLRYGSTCAALFRVLSLSTPDFSQSISKADILEDRLGYFRGGRHDLCTVLR